MRWTLVNEQYVTDSYGDEYETSICDDRGKRVTRVVAEDQDAKEAQANARLIAAAPELLAALERCEELLSGITDIRSDLAEFQDGYLRQARAAIANARGLK